MTYRYFCIYCKKKIPDMVKAEHPQACFCSEECSIEHNTFSIYGDTKEERERGKRYEMEMKAALTKKKAQ